MRILISLLTLLVALDIASGQQSATMSVVFREDFESGQTTNWLPTDASAWEIRHAGQNHVYSQHKKRSNHKPPYRSPYNISLRKNVHVSDFELTARVLSTHKDYNHRDACLFFGYQDQGHFYYVHFGKKTDPHANQIFIVNGKDRTKISLTTTEGTPWNDKWHTVKIVRQISTGAISVYFDNMKKPVMTAKDKTFGWGQIGMGSFDDTADWDDIVLKGIKVNHPTETQKTEK